MRSIPKAAVSCVASLLLSALGCGGGASDDDNSVIDARQVDANADASVDATPNPCGERQAYEAALVDWDSSNDAFLGVFGASVTNSAAPTETISTPPNGRIEMCLTPPAANSPWQLTMDLPAGYVDAQILLRDTDFMAPEFPLIARGITSARLATFLSSFGATANPDAAQVLVYQAIDCVDQTLSGTHDLVIVGNDDAVATEFSWAVGLTGRYLLFVNVAVDDGPVTLMGESDSPLTFTPIAGQLTIIRQLDVLI